MRLKSFLCQTTIGIRNDVILVVGLGFLINDGIVGTRWLRVMGDGSLMWNSLDGRAKHYNLDVKKPRYF